MRELQRVAEEVHQDLLHLLPIADHRRQVLRDVDDDRELRAHGNRLELGFDLADELRHVEPRKLQRHPARLDAGDVENLVDDRQQMPAVRLHPGEVPFRARLERTAHALQQHRRVAEHRVERRPELVRHVGEELRLERRGLLELDGLAAEQLVLVRDVGGGRLNPPLQLVGRVLQLLVQLRLFDRLATVVQNRDNGRQLSVIRQDLAGDRLDRQRFAGRRIEEADLAHAALIGADEHAGDERREMRVVGLHPALLERRGARRDREQPLGRPVHERRRAARVGDDDRVGDRVDDEIQAVAFRARLHLGDPQAAVVLLDFLAGAAQVGDVPQDRDDAAALARIVRDGAQELEHEVRSVDRIDEEQLAARRTRFLNRLARQRRGQQHVVHAHRAAAPFAFLFRRGEQGQRTRVGDEQPAFGVGQENRVGDGVDDVVEQGALASLPAIAFEQRLMPQHLRQLLREQRGEPA